MNDIWTTDNYKGNAFTDNMVVYYEEGKWRCDMRDIWTTENYKRDKAEEIAKKYGLNLPMVRDALEEGDKFTDNMLVYSDVNYYYVKQLDKCDNVVDLIKYLLVGGAEHMESIDDIVCIIIDGVKYEASVNINQCEVKTPWTIANENAIAREKAKAVAIAETYGLNISKVEKALLVGEIFSDNMIVYYGEYNEYSTVQTESDYVRETIQYLLTENICKIENIVCVIVNGVRCENLRIKYVHGRRYII